MSMSKRVQATLLAAALLAIVGIAPASGAPGKSGSAGDKPASVAAERARYWTAARRAAAIPRDLVIDERGRGFMRQADGTYRPYGKAAPAPMGAEPPTVTDQDPSGGVTIGASYDFKATVTDVDGVKAVTFNISRSDGSSAQTVTASRTSRKSNVWSAAVSGLTDAVDWQWTVTAKDGAKRGGNTGTSSPPATFTVSTGSGGGGDDGGGDGGGTISEPSIVKNAEWTYGGDVQNAAGRIYFEMPTNSSHTSWAGYVCSGTAAGDGGRGGSIVITAAHCVYDDTYNSFAQKVLFIPNQDGTTGAGTDRNCDNDPLGCWSPTHGVVDINWTRHEWPDNIPWDYAYYVVPDTGHAGTGSHTSLEGAVNELPIQFTPPQTGVKTHALGYSYDDDPNFMYCAEAMSTSGSANWWLGNCGLSGGSSGGPWVQPMNLSTGTGPIISVNSWGYRGQPGMAGPKLSGTSAQCVFNNATLDNENDTTGDGGFKATC